MLKTNKSIRSSYTTLAAGLALSTLFVAGTAGAVTATAPLLVGATVATNCTIGTTALAFGAYDPTGAAAKAISGGVSVTCTNGAAAAISLGQGANADGTSTPDAPVRRMTNGTSFLNYSLSATNGGAEWGDTTTTDVDIDASGGADDLVVFGVIAAGQTPSAGTYADSVLATVTF